MQTFKNLKISAKLLLLTGIFGLCLVVYGIVAYRTLNMVKVDGELFQRIAAAKDLIADVLPPPMYLVEAHLVTHQMQEETDRDAIDALVGRGKVLQKEYEDRHKYWSNILKAGDLKHDLLTKSSEPAQRYFKIRNEQFIPALLS